MSDLALLPIIGVIVSLFVQFVKSSIEPRSKAASVITVVAVSAVAGGCYWTFKDTAFWEHSLQILLYANAFYGFIVKSFQE